MVSDRRAISISASGFRAVLSPAPRRVTAAPTYDMIRSPLFWGTRFLIWCVWCSERSRQRDALSKLDDRLLNDVGITRQQANDEAAKPFWK
jgi:uncharacterized protein YjiS (DUF1127 family)